MASASRFPHLSLPFALVGACGGWLSTGLLANPLIAWTRPGKQGVAALCAMAFASATGALLTRWCVGPRYAYELVERSPDARARTDSWPRHVLAVLATGALTGATVAFLVDAWGGPAGGAFSGFLCSIAFVPVCAAVLAMARRAQRARMGSLVAGSDRRAVWGILATALAITTLEALPDWPAARAGEIPAPAPALAMAIAAAALTLALLVADVAALRGARRAVAPGLTARDPGAADPMEHGAARLDLGLGEDMLERLTRGAAAYRGRDRALALIQGSPERALSALRRAVLRSAVSLAVVGLVLAGHALARTERAGDLYAAERLR